MRNPISVSPIKTDIFHTSDDLLPFLVKHLENEPLEGNVLVITSKIISLAENQVIPKSNISKRQLVKQEAEHCLCEGGYGVELTIKHGLLIPSAGIDESNSPTEDYIVFPKKPYESAKAIWSYLKIKYSLKNFAIIITDSHTMPLRKGVTGIALAHWGLKATQSLVDQPDLFQRPLKYTHINVVDALATMAVFAMGESNNCTPLALISGAKVEFTNSSDSSEIRIEPELDLYYPLLKPFLES